LLESAQGTHEGAAPAEYAADSGGPGCQGPGCRICKQGESRSRVMSQLMVLLDGREADPPQTLAAMPEMPRSSHSGGQGGIHARMVTHQRMLQYSDRINLINSMSQGRKDSKPTHTCPQSSLSQAPAWILSWHLCPLDLLEPEAGDAGWEDSHAAMGSTARHQSEPPVVSTCSHSPVDKLDCCMLLCCLKRCCAGTPALSKR
jgi:hypothetical protein